MYTANSIHNYISHDKTADDFGYWKVFTESVCGKNHIVELGIHYGQLHKIAFVLSNYAKRTLYFESVLCADHCGEYNADVKGMCKKVAICTTAIDKIRSSIKNNPFIKMTEEAYSVHNAHLLYFSEEKLKKI